MKVSSRQSGLNVSISKFISKLISFPVRCTSAVAYSRIQLIVIILLDRRTKKLFNKERIDSNRSAMTIIT